MKVIFLDIDGVIVTNRYLSELEKKSQPCRDGAGYAYFCPRCLANVEELAEKTGARVVLFLLLALLPAKPGRCPHVLPLPRHQVRRVRRYAHCGLPRRKK